MKKKKILVGISFLIVLFFILVFYRRKKCGDGICQRWEKKRGSCQKDCVSASNVVMPDDWTGYGLYEKVVFDSSQVCADSLEEPKWSVTGCGSIVGANIGKKIEWNSGHGDCQGTLTVVCGDIKKTASLKATLPKEISPDFWSHVYFPNPASQRELKAFCRQSESQRQKLYQKQIEEAQVLSDKLETYIRGWLKGENPATLPLGFLPESIDNEKTHSWTLLKPEEANPQDQWYYYPAREEPALNNFQTLSKNNAATHITYLKTHFIAPFDSQLLTEGDFPHARFMSYQISPPFDPEYPYGGNRGQMEVPIVDIDIEPDPGNVNPFRTGENRNATKRHYHLYFDLKAGNMATLNPVIQNEYFRAPGNKRVGGPFAAAGPYANGAITPAVLWLRYYVPDEGTRPLAGVSLPKLLLQLKTGEKFWIQPDFSFAVQRQVKVIPGFEMAPLEPLKISNSSLGWNKFFDIYLAWAEGKTMQKTQPYGKTPESQAKKNLREQYTCHLNKGPNTSPPGNIGHSATDCPYNSYLTRPFQLGANKVYALTGRLPTTPKTSQGQATMQKAQARYWSICHTGRGPDRLYNGVVYGCLYDEEIAVDKNRDYIIAYSRGAERPTNATEKCGVTWQDFGPESAQGFPIRWMSVYPDHYMQDYAPNDKNIPWETGTWSQENYDKTLVGENKPGVMGPYKPIIHYLAKEEFEALGCPVDAKMIPEWQ